MKETIYKKVEFIRENIGLFENPNKEETNESLKKRLGELIGFEDELNETNGHYLVKKIALIINEETGIIEKISPKNLKIIK